jgi:hypothetical protein
MLRPFASTVSNLVGLSSAQPLEEQQLAARSS